MFDIHDLFPREMPPCYRGTIADKIVPISVGIRRLFGSVPEQNWSGKGYFQGFMPLASASKHNGTPAPDFCRKLGISGSVRKHLASRESFCDVMGITGEQPGVGRGNPDDFRPVASFAAGWPSRMSKAPPKGGGALAEAQVTNTRLSPVLPQQCGGTGMRFVGPVHEAQVLGAPTPIDELDWMLERVRFLVAHRLRADAFYGLEVTIIPVRDEKVLVANFRDRDRLFAYEKVRISIPENAEAPWFTAKGEAVTISPLHNSGCGMGAFQLLGGRLD